MPYTVRPGSVWPYGVTRPKWLSRQGKINKLVNIFYIWYISQMKTDLNWVTLIINGRLTVKTRTLISTSPDQMRRMRRTRCLCFCGDHLRPLMLSENGKNIPRFVELWIQISGLSTILVKAWEFPVAKYLKSDKILTLIKFSCFGDCILKITTTSLNGHCKYPL